MSVLQNKIDFAVIVSVTNANPNGDPLNGNRPRENYEGFGEISDVCIKRKIRNRMMDMGKPIFVQSNERCIDGYKSLRERAKASKTLEAAQKKKDMTEYANAACQQWMDVRTFGQVFAFKGKEKGENSVSVGVRGPVSIHPAYSMDPVDVSSIQITKSVNSEPNDKDADQKSSDTMGMKHRIPFGLYVFYGSINCQLAEITGFTQEDADCVHQALCSLFENDTSSARPDGSMEVCRVYWWQHNCKTGQYSSAKVHRSLKITKKDKKVVNGEEVKIDLPHCFGDYDVKPEALDGLTPEINDGI